MKELSLNSNLHKAKNSKQDEFYTQISYIENEMKHYEKYFENKHIFCNCDDPEYSNFWRYFALNFDRLKLKRLTSTHYSEIKQETFQMDMFKEVPKEFINKKTFITLEETGIELPLGYMTDIKNGSGDFRSESSIEILKMCDIVVTNPPFSLFSDYIKQLISYDKDFIVLGSQNALTTNSIFPLLKENKLWTGVFAGNMEFRVPNDDKYKRDGKRFWIDDSGNYWRSLGNICWFTNLTHYKRKEELLLYKKYTPESYSKFENYDAINVDKVSEIPFDYTGPMGVPVTFIYKHNPDQFELLGQTHSGDTSLEVENIRTSPNHRHRGIINGKQKYARVLIRRVSDED